MGASKKILITGLSGFLGRALSQELPPGAEIVGTTRSLSGGPPVDRNANWLECDLEDPEAVAQCLDASSVETVVHAAGEANVDNVQRNSLAGINSNAISTMNLALACARRNIHLIYVSTNAVFSGEDAPYGEDFPANPVNHYGVVKLASERIAIDLNPQTTVVRPILMYGWSDEDGRTNPVLMTIERLRNGEQLQMVDDVVENPLYVRECAKAIWAVIASGQLGVFHLAGATTVNRFDLGVQTARAFGLDDSLISRVQSDAFPSIAPRPANTTFDTTRMRDLLRLEPLSLEVGLAEMRSQE